MTQIILIIIGIAIIALLLTRKTRKQVVGICAAAIGIDAKKRENKEKILKLFEDAQNKSLAASGPLPLKKEELNNSDIREALGISDRSVIRYMDELEREGKVEQIGNTARRCLPPKAMKTTFRPSENSKKDNFVILSGAKNLSFEPLFECRDPSLWLRMTVFGRSECP